MNVGDTVTVQYEDEDGDAERIIGEFLGYHKSVDGENGFWLKYVHHYNYDDLDHILTSWWPLSQLVLEP